MLNLDVPQPTSTKAKTIFFPNLDGLRAIAAFIVVISHIERLKDTFNISRLPYIATDQLGTIGVKVFFVLSGFLITYLLLEEKKSFHHINYKKFYIRRILRIWPLYFLVLLFGYFVYPQFESAKALWLSVFFLPNVAFVLSLLPAIIDPIWSVGAEEQFYIFQPHLVRMKRIKHIFYATLSIIAFFWLLDLLVDWPAESASPQAYVKRFLWFCRFDSMLIGSVAAMLLFCKKNGQWPYPTLWKILLSRYTQLACLLGFGIYLLLVLTIKFPIIPQVISLLSAVLIINLSQTNSSIISLQHPFLMRAGKISYGIYLIHKIPIAAVVYVVATYFHLKTGLIANILIYGMSFIFSYMLAHFVYYYYEVHFLKLKSKFGVIHKE